MLLSGLAHGAHTRVEKAKDDLTKKLDAITPDKALLEELKETSMGCVERSQNMAPNVSHLHETVSGLNISTLSQTISEMENQDNAAREEREKVLKAEMEHNEMQIEMMFKQQIARHNEGSVKNACPDVFQHPYRFTKT
mmetsp:Transcript_37197/g.80977  ORF Transcript_37197/g.80977 Transcript_37197/m.80977 type:complete len:138 (-) Transcript_37197:183-596(-)|eukprot:CAMPEP_0118929664 /NCGR_PEP_ID=MMETSP1169-20130426/6604_1 /TAXON_ID=36882 /ORGANISM="Pyramimonas obovata, Strain CCMP722" /LENGTH=137 /DNA_ID=CAMNT_0006871903 /DNA_START=223 /DNA_END=636 /DNA_ORIENTATION=-